MLVLVPFILLSHYIIPFAGVPIIGQIFVNIVDLILAFFVYKALSREAHRYMQLRGGGRGPGYY